MALQAYLSRTRDFRKSGKLFIFVNGPKKGLVVSPKIFLNLDCQDHPVDLSSFWSSSSIWRFRLTWLGRWQLHGHLMPRFQWTRSVRHPDGLCQTCLFAIIYWMWPLRLSVVFFLQWSLWLQLNKLFSFCISPEVLWCCVFCLPLCCSLLCPAVGWHELFHENGKLFCYIV